MTMKAETVLCSVICEPDGTVTIKLHKRVSNDDKVLSDERHTIRLAPGEDMDARFKMESASLESYGFPPYTAERARIDIAKVGQTLIDMTRVGRGPQ